MKHTNTYRYCSRITGELQTNLPSVLKAAVEELFKLHLVNFRWEEGF